MSLQEMLCSYACLLVRTGCALKPGQTLFLTVPIDAAPFARLVVREAWEAGAGDVIIEWEDQMTSRLRYLHAPMSAFEAVPEWKRTLMNGSVRDGAALAKHRINLSATHVDFMIGTADLSVTGITADGTETPVFRNGNWAGEFV